MLKSRLSCFGFSNQMLSISCFGLLLAGAVTLSGCAGNKPAAEEAKKPESIEMKVVNIDQVSKLGNKKADGQYLITKVMIKNLSNESLTLQPADFKLEYITDDESQRYSQPAERSMSNAFRKEFGDENKSKLMDYTPSNLYPRLELERFFVFMVPSNAKVKEYQITYTSSSPAIRASVPLVSQQTTIHDHRRNIPNSEPAEP